jgi:hypothetical protein
VTTISIDPPLPDGINDWYVTPPEITLMALDNYSGVGNTEYQVNNGSWMAYIGPFIFDPGGDNTLYYRSVDIAGNVEVLDAVDIKLDTTMPAVALLKPTTGLYLFDRKIMDLPNQTTIIGAITIQAEAMDTVSGLNRVEFYINAVAKARFTSSPYEWLWDTTLMGRRIIAVCAYDNAGNMAIDEREMWILNIKPFRFTPFLSWTHQSQWA